MDGVSVAKEIELKDKLMNMGAQMVKEVASRTSDNRRGTTTATVLAQAIGARRHEVRCRRHEPDGPQARHRQGRSSHRRRAQEDCPSLHHHQGNRQVGAISANSDYSIGERIAEAIEKVGKEGVITVEDGKSSMTNSTLSKACSSTALPVALLHQQVATAVAISMK